MKIILLQDVKNLGNKGDVKDVAEGYAQNFLLPKKMAEIATETIIKLVQNQKAKDKKIEIEKIVELRALANKLKNKKITILAKEKDGKLFGSVTAKNIQEALQEEGLNISLDSIIIKEAIKKIGSFEIEIGLAEEVETKIIIEVKGN